MVYVYNTVIYMVKVWLKVNLYVDKESITVFPIMGGYI